MPNNNGAPLVSIVVPIYNAEKTLESCLNSILAQTTSNYEVILVDDGSKDRSAAICEKYKAEYKDKIRYIRQENSGPATARNKAIDNSRGKYVGFVDADDTIAPNMLQTMSDVAEQHQVDMVICAYWRRDGENEEAVTYTLPEGLYTDDHYKAVSLSILEERDGDVPPYSWVRLTRRDVFERTGLRFCDGLIRSEDYHFWTKVQFSISSVYLLSQTPLYYYVENKNSITHTHVKDYWSGAKFIYNDLKNSLPENPEVRQKLDVMLVKRSLIALNNAAFNKKIKEVYREIFQVLQDDSLNLVINDLKSCKSGYYIRYRTLMSNNRKALIAFKYLGRWIKDRG